MLYQITANMVRKSPVSRQSFQQPTFYVEASTVGEAVTKAKHILSPDDLYCVHLTAFHEESGDYMAKTFAQAKE
jgi:hypothetical protein